ncbi:MAG: sigma-54-dependent Fis family transcriptional regulator [Bacteroidaceae bacterium]|nr:sigma-54-dependent Fis family transcriptional regulator [Bacteroidaceae bacterium]MBQ5817500.1 sigma-54-dependent Fis family transcriptional regulator [Bacteroidaceae bacterium]
MMNKGKVLIVDDNEDVLFSLNLLLKPHVEAVRVATTPDRIEHFMKVFEPDVIFLDMNFTRDAVSGQEGFKCLEDILKIDRDAVVIFMTAYSDTEKAVRAIKAGATDFVSKPWDNDKLLSTLKSAMELRFSRLEIMNLKEKVAALGQYGGEDAPLLIGESPAMQRIKANIERFAKSDANILLLGENGTGKDVVARLLHSCSQRSGCPFVAIDLGSVPEQLFESELFGYEKGAFTGAGAAKAGRMEVAAGGTLFLDEIGNLPLLSQAKLLTAIEKREIVRVGGTKPKQIDVRLICATNADLAAMVADGDFRQDLRFRVNTIEIHIPPLRERGVDVILLAEFFLAKFARKYNKEVRSIGREAKKILLYYEWPGNVRELQHAVERAVILEDTTILRAHNLMLAPDSGVAVMKKTKGDELTMNLEELERDAIDRAMKRADGNITRAAELLGITRFALYRKLGK